MEIALTGLAQKVQSRVDEWNGLWKSLEAENDKLNALRQSVLDDIETGAPGDLLAKSGALEGKVLSIHQRKVAALRERRELLVACQTAQETATQELEVALSKAEKQAEAGLKKAGISAEADPNYQHNPEAARHRFMFRVRECSGVRQAAAEFQDAREILQRISEAKHLDRMVLQGGIDELHAVARKLMRL